MRRGQFLDLLSKLLEVEQGTVSGPEDLEELGWDSLKAIEFLALVDEHLDGFVLKPKQVMESKQVSDLLALVHTCLTD